MTSVIRRPITQLQRGDATSIALVGDIDTADETDLRIALAESVAHPTLLTVIDCGQCGFLGGGAVEDIVDAAASLHRLGALLQVHCADPRTRQVFTLLGASHLLE
jgi:anti-anti-sigma regulatory factor